MTDCSAGLALLSCVYAVVLGALAAGRAICTDQTVGNAFFAGYCPVGFGIVTIDAGIASLGFFTCFTVVDPTRSALGSVQKVACAALVAFGRPSASSTSWQTC